MNRIQFADGQADTSLNERRSEPCGGRQNAPGLQGELAGSSLLKGALSWMESCASELLGGVLTIGRAGGEMIFLNFGKKKYT